MENRPPSGDLGEKFRRALARVLAADAAMPRGRRDVQQTFEDALGIDLEETYLVGTGYGRVTLPFSKEHIRSEILCHGLGAHMMYPETRTVLDIGGQDTKGIQVDASGIVTNFQMNDRCAAGCGRYLGYIADEMNMGLHELGPTRNEVGAARRASTPPARCSPAPSCATGCRSARSARTSSRACTARSSCGRSPSFRARAA